MSADLKQWLSEGIAAAKAGNDAAARERLTRVVDQDPHNEAAWLWLASVVESDDDLRVCLENVLAINPEHQAARARLAMLESAQAPVVQPEPASPEAPVVSPQAAALPSAPVLAEELVGCPYCGRELQADARVCPHCRGRLIIESPRPSSLPGRIWLLTASWVGLALVYAIVDTLTLAALMLLVDEAAQQAALLTVYITRYVVNLAASPIIPSENLFLFLQVMAWGEALAVAWCLALAAFTSSRRPGAVPLAYVTIALGALLALVQTAAGVYVSIVKLIATLAVGAFTFASLSDFAWRTTRYELRLERGLKTALDYYNAGLHYREKGMLASTILHWQKAAALEPERVAFRLKLGNLLYQMGRLSEAREHIKAALSRAPVGSPEAEDLRQFLDRIQARLDANAR